MSGTVGNIIIRVGGDASQLSEELKKTQNTILTFKDASLEALKSFGLPNISSTNLVESIQSGQRVIVNFAQESGETLTQFQTRVRTVFEEAGIDITEYEKVLTDANKVHAEFAKGAVKSFQAVSAASETSVSATMNKFTELKESLATSFAAIGDSSIGMGEKMAIAGDIINTALPELFALGMAVMFVDKIGEWGKSVEDFAAKTQDAENSFKASMGSMSGEAEKFSKNLSRSWGINSEDVEKMMGKEYLNNKMMGFAPQQSEDMSQNITKLSYSLGKLRGEDPSVVFDSLQRGMEGETRGLKDLGISVSTTDLKNLALSEGVIKQGQTLTTAQTAMMAYQEIMKKAGGQIDYYATQADTLSNQQAKLNANWEEMKRQLADALIPVLTDFKKALLVIEEALIQVGDAAAGAIQDITLFAEDAYSAIQDILSLNFGQINTDWNNNYNAVMNAKVATDGATGAANNQTAATNAQNTAQKALNKSVNANTMSFDQLHNITNSGTAAAQGQTDAVNNLANALGNLGQAGNMGNITNNQSKGIVIPVAFKVPPFPPIVPPPAVTVPVKMQVPDLSPVEAAVKGFSPSTVTVSLGLQNQLEPGLSQAQTAVNTWKTNSDAAADDWKATTVEDLAAVGAALRLLSPVFSTSASDIKNWGTDSSSAAKGWKTETIADLTRVKGYLGDALTPAFNTSATDMKKWGTDSSTAAKEWKSETTSDMTSVAGYLGDTLTPAFNASAAKTNDWKNTSKTAMDAWSFDSMTNLQKVLASVNSLIAAYNTLASVERSLNGGGSPSQAPSSFATNWLAPAGEAIHSIGSGLGQSIEGVAPALGSLGVGGLAALALAPIGLASGGIVNSPTLAMVGEGGGPEAVIPLDRLGSMMGGNASTANPHGNASQTPMIQVAVNVDGRTLARTIRPYTVNENDRNGKRIGYDSSYNYPK